MCSEYCSCQVRVLTQSLRFRLLYNTQSCYNNTVYEEMRKEAIQAILLKNQFAFRAQASRGLRPVEDVGRGCHCVKSHCLKKYCECFQVKRFCDGRCRCMQCQNQSGFSESTPVPSRLVGTGYRNLRDYQQHFLRPPILSRNSTSSLDRVVTDSVVDRICSSLLEVASSGNSASGTHDARLSILDAFTDSLRSLIIEEEAKRKQTAKGAAESGGRKRKRTFQTPVL